MRPIRLWVLAVGLLPSTLSAAVLPDAGQVGEGPAPIPRSGDRAVAYVVVTDRQLQGAFMPLVQARTRGGLRAAVVTLDAIEHGYPGGVDRAERIRMFLKDAHANWGTQWVLLGGDASVIPMRRARLRFGGLLPDIDLPTDQYYACLDGTWNADGDSLWGELPGPGEPGDDVDLIPDLYVGRAPVRSHTEATDFVRRTLAYEGRLSAAGHRSALLAAEVISGLVDGAFATEALRPALEADPDRSIVRLYENAAAWPGSLKESRPALLEALGTGFDLAFLVGAGGHGVIVAGQDFCCADYVTSDDLLGLTNAPQYPFVYALSAYTTAPDPPLSIGAALMHAPRGGAAAVLGTTDIQFVSIASNFMLAYFGEALGSDLPPIGVALARTITAIHSGSFFGDIQRLTTQGNVLLGDPALHVDPGDAAHVLRIHGRPALPVRDAALASRGGEVASLTDVGASLAIALRDAGVPATGAAAGPAPGQEMGSAPARLEAQAPGPARATATLRFEFSATASGARYELALFDVLGRRVRSLAKGAATPGRFDEVWDLRSDAGIPVPDGLYFARLSFAGTSLARSLLVLR